MCMKLYEKYFKFIGICLVNQKAGPPLPSSNVTETF